ncbi:MAG: deoxyguanosinetriphosphate triphosphohydrolase [Proteobacteria bacterium]|nr:deoxyguanosinetriphosphate triphosphohydrolase [Pseudomonadota bacterium]MBU1708915.1 deoxyguanosinetriphosphate triphosphohydrolase [Pseudomonadota bacterium]
MSIREELEQRESEYLSPYACLSAMSRGRVRSEKECTIRTAFQRDRDRIVYSKAFRRLKHKTQVFLAPSGDHYRTRLTHTLEVSEIARTIGRAMRLNEDLVEAIALAHDLGHTPFGHAGETVLNELTPGGFSHYRQSLRVVDVLENQGLGLNLSYEVRDGIAKHSKGYGEVIPGKSQDLPETAEGIVVRYADIIAYLNHDLDDAIRSGVIREEDVPGGCHRVLGNTHSERVFTMISGVLSGTVAGDHAPVFGIEEEVGRAMQLLRNFLFHNVYRSSRVHNEFVKATKILRELYAYCMEHRDFLEREMGTFASCSSFERRVCDFIASMTDRYAQNMYHRLFLPGAVQKPE